MQHLNGGRNKLSKVDRDRSLRSRPCCALIKARPNKAGFSLILSARYARGLAALTKTTLPRCRLAPASTFVSTGAPPPPRPRGLRLPLRGAVSVLGVTACGMIAAPLSREVTLRRTAPCPVGLRGLWSGRPLFRHRAVAATPSRRLQFRFRSFFRLLPGVAAGR